jgi:hypothetical protein
VKQGLAAEVRLSAYKQRRTPTLHGRVLKVSADALTDEKLNKTYYAAEVAIDPDQLAAVPDVTLYPGMPADVMIMTGKRTALQYLVDPIRDVNVGYCEDAIRRTKGCLSPPSLSFVQSWQRRRLTNGSSDPLDNFREHSPLCVGELSNNTYQPLAKRSTIRLCAGREDKSHP